MTATETATTGRGEASPRRWRVMGVVSIALLMTSVDQTITATALPAIQRDLSTRLNWSSWTITVYALAQMVMLPLAGRISDEYGRKRVFLISVIVFTAASFACGLATNIAVLIAVRALQGLGGGAFVPSATGLVADHFGPDRDRAIGMFTSIFQIGAILGPVLGGVITQYWSWRGIFLINVPFGIVLTAGAAILLPACRPRRGQSIDIGTIALLSGGLLGVMLALTHLGSPAATVRHDQILQPGSLAPLLTGAALLAGFVWRSAHVEDAVIPTRLLWGRGFAAINIVNLLSGSATIAFGAVLPLYAQERYRISTLGASTLLIARAVGAIAVAGISTLLLRRTGYRRPLVTGFVMVAVGLFLTAAPAANMSAYAWLTLAAAIAGIGMGVAIPASANASLQLAPDSVAAIAGIRIMFRQAGGIVGISMIAAFTSGSNDPAAAQAVSFIGLGVALILLIPLLLQIPDHRGRW